MKQIIRTTLLITFLTFSGINGIFAQLSDQWIGTWAGEVEIFNETGLVQKVMMQLNIESVSDSSFQWKISYGQGENADVRDYRLLRNAEMPNQLIMDELNGIRLYMSHINDGLYSWFGLNTSELLVSYELKEGEILFTTISSQNGSMIESGGTNAETPKVKAQPVKVVQKAILQKKL